MNLQEKYKKLMEIISEMGEITVAYSGGVDSTLLLRVASDVLKEKCLGVLAISPTFPSREYDRAIEVAESFGASLRVIQTHELEDENFVENPVNRCYFCKSELFDSIAKIAESERFSNFVDGSNQDDLGDHRPGMKALKERNVRSPLQEAELTKNEIRELSRKLGLPTWNKDELACLSSRFPYGEKIDKEKLHMVDLAEARLSDLGFRNIRARHSSLSVTIEVDPDQVSALMEPDMKEQVESYLKSIGYQDIIINPDGYRRGRLNDGITPQSGPDAGSLRLAL
jgi:pyridinium-3,5-biscarboxylic acid mononucleotide sulfurtransferase